MATCRSSNEEGRAGSIINFRLLAVLLASLDLALIRLPSSLSGV